MLAGVRDLLERGIRSQKTVPEDRKTKGEGVRESESVEAAPHVEGVTTIRLPVIPRPASLSGWASHGELKHHRQQLSSNRCKA